MAASDKPTELEVVVAEVRREVRAGGHGELVAKLEPVAPSAVRFSLY